MTIADRYIFRALLGPMLFGIAAFVSILAAGGPLLQLTNLAFEGAPLGSVAWLFVLSLPPMVVISLPMSMLMATLLGFGRLSSDSELVAMYAGGISLYRAAVPVAVLAVVMSVVTVALNEKVVPWSITAADALRDTIEKDAHEQKQFELPQFDNGKLVARVYADRFDPKTHILHGVTVVKWEKGVASQVLSAGHANFRNENLWILYDVDLFNLKAGRTSPGSHWNQWKLTLSQTPAEITNIDKKAKDMSMAQLRAAIRRSKGWGQPTAEYEVAWWNRWAVPFASVVFAMIGLPLGLRPQRSSGGLGLGLSIVIIFLYWVVWSYTSKLGGYGNIPPFLASWLANILGIGVGAALIARAPK